MVRHVWHGVACGTTWLAEGHCSRHGMEWRGMSRGICGMARGMIYHVSRRRMASRHPIASPSFLDLVWRVDVHPKALRAGDRRGVSFAVQGARGLKE